MEKSQVQLRAEEIINDATILVLTTRHQGFHGNESNKALLRAALELAIRELRKSKAHDNKAGHVITILQAYIDTEISKLTNRSLLNKSPGLLEKE